ncbi:hypothetical protein ACV229_23690 [Burkholderia sp. MR1-5-21]
MQWPCAYRKLGMHDKSQIAGVLGAADDPALDALADAGREPG